MTNKVYQVPYGTKDILPGEMKSRRRIENAIIDVFDKWGYDEVKTPDFEYVDTFGAAGSKGDFRFFDRSNNLLALRNDMTAPIARLTATRLQGGEKIKRLCYLANLYRYEEIQAGRQCEFEQAGVEMLGASGAAADAEVIVAYDILVRLEYPAHLDSDLRFLVGACKILYIVNDSRDTDRDLGEEFGAESVGDLDRYLLYLFHFGVGLNLFDKHDVTLANADDIIARLVREHILKHLKGHHVGLAAEFDKQHDAIFLGVEVKLLGLDVNIARQDIVKDDILDKRALVIFLVVKLLYVGKRDRQHLGQHLSHFILALNENGVFGFHIIADRTVGIAALAYHIRRVKQIVAQTGHKLSYSHKLRTGNNVIGFINYSYCAVNGIFHLMNYTLK